MQIQRKEKMKETVKVINGVEIIFGEKVLFMNEMRNAFVYAYIIKNDEMVKHGVWKEEEYTEDKIIEFVEQYKNESIK